MLDFISNQMLFYLSLAIVLFLPGYFLLSAIFGRQKIFSPLEKFVIACGLSIVSVDFIFFLYAKLGLHIGRLSSLAGIGLFLLACFLVRKFRKPGGADEENNLFAFSRHQYLLVFLLLFLTLFIKVAYLSGTVLPSATDMGHHMYWAKWLAENGQLPTYEGLPDFIIGEHVIFGIIALVSGASFFSAFPPVILLLVNILGVLAVFMLVLRIFENKNTAVLVLLFLGVLYAVSSPQAKFVSGGVIGNIIGNFLLPLAFYFFYRAFAFYRNNGLPGPDSRRFLALAVFLTAGLFYTHHLTAFIFLFILLMLSALFILANLRDWKTIFSRLAKIAFSPPVLAAAAVSLIFFFFVFTPNYAKLSAVDTAVGNPVKVTRTGLSFDNVRATVGEARVALGICGLFLLAAAYQRKNFGYAIIAAWTVMLFLMSMKPHWLFIDLPSSRIGNYLTYPLAILSAYAFSTVFEKYSRQPLLQGAFAVLLTFSLVSGLADSAAAFKEQNNSQELVRTFHAAEYAARNAGAEDVVLKDHNYLTGDAWMKLFFMRGYKYPDSRGFFKRYEDPTNPREMCTLEMISNPNGAAAQECFARTGTNLIIVNPAYDSGQFKKLANFDLIYANETVAAFYRK